MVIAYEPIWAIGTGRTATADDAQQVCAAIRACVAELAGAEAAATRAHPVRRQREGRQHRRADGPARHRRRAGRRGQPRSRRVRPHLQARRADAESRTHVGCVVWNVSLRTFRTTWNGCRYRSVTAGGSVAPRSCRSGRTRAGTYTVERRHAGRFHRSHTTSLRHHIRRTIHVRTTKRSKFAALAVGLSLIVAACGSDDDAHDAAQHRQRHRETDRGPRRPTRRDRTDAPRDRRLRRDRRAGRRRRDDGSPTTSAADAVWDDGIADHGRRLQCTYDAIMNTRRLAEHRRLRPDPRRSTPATRDKQVVAEFKTVVRAVQGPVQRPHQEGRRVRRLQRRLRRLRRPSIPFSDRAGSSTRGAREQLVLVPNPNYWGDDSRRSTEGRHGSQGRPGDRDRLAARPARSTSSSRRPTPDHRPGAGRPEREGLDSFGGDYEGLYFQQQDGPFADPIFRRPSPSRSTVEALFQQIYAPIVTAPRC